MLDVPFVVVLDEVELDDDDDVDVDVDVDVEVDVEFDVEFVVPLVVPLPALAGGGDAPGTAASRLVAAAPVACASTCVSRNAVT